MALKRQVNKVEIWKLSLCKPTSLVMKYVSRVGVRLGDKNRAYPAAIRVVRESCSLQCPIGTSALLQAAQPTLLTHGF